MNKLLVALAALASAVPAHAEAIDLGAFGQAYFNAWTATQAPNATAADLENYLSLLTDDVGHQHLPYDPDSTRHPTGKADMREGMTYYLGAHTAYSAELGMVTPGYNVVVITYSTASSGVHPQTGETIEQSYDTLEVLEIEDGKVAVIRKYSE
ncbi:nuclear transport factor 2 family protein [Marinihelvus fidelis]|uniref:Nuclear transport factor 2 family protein n=1 Tax=Marinihelvus fidelis TaxID=2613842 RepID=A0A5N0T467_9GAMM|nr:nuclear transport factor 2 family protein [Marinihelvus fidelis]KAA9129652.1 nuclear transport factor 2 family protein [Marinihelvus fidelis]